MENRRSDLVVIMAYIHTYIHTCIHTYIQVVDCLVAEMENRRSDLVVIMAGYTKEMSEFFRSNAGLQSRFPNVYNFPDYTYTVTFCLCGYDTRTWVVYVLRVCDVHVRYVCVCVHIMCL